MVFDWLVLRIPGWNRKVRKLRKMWNRAREHALKKKDPLRRILLEKLDHIETSLKMIEEQPLTRRQRKRLTREIKIVLAEVKILLKGKAEEFATAARTTPAGFRRGKRI